MIEREKGWAEFISIQNHYNVIYRETERDMAQEGMSMTPFSPLAAGRVCRLWDSESDRAKMDKIAQIKYDQEKEIDYPIVLRINEIAKKLNCTMAQVSMAWLLNKPLVASPVFGCTKLSQLEDLCGAVKIKLSKEDIDYLEELYKPHIVMGPMKKEQKNPYEMKK